MRMKKPSITENVMMAGFNRCFYRGMVLLVVSRKNLRIIEKYVFLGEYRYRVHVTGTNIVFNVKALDDEEAINKAKELAEKIGLTDEIIDKIRERYKS